MQTRHVSSHGTPIPTQLSPKVVLFERTTFLVIAHTQAASLKTVDSHRFEKISNIIKQFKLSCRCVSVPQDQFLMAITKYALNSKSTAQFQSMEVRTKNFAAYIDVFTPNTYIMVIQSDATIRMWHFNEKSLVIFNT